MSTTTRTSEQRDIQAPLPPGWEAIYSNDAKRQYFVDHINKKTQWEDPRLTHSFIWGEEENALLRKLTDSFVSVPENVIRDALLRSGFKAESAANELKAWNKNRSLSPNDNSKRGSRRSADGRGSKQSSPVPSTRNNAGATPVDDFAYLFVKSKFSEVPDSVINDVLINCNNSEEKACKELKAMGFSGGKRQMAEKKIERLEINKEEKAKLKLKRIEEAINQLSSEFSTCSTDEIRKILMDTEGDLTESRSLLRQIESKKKTEEFFAQSGRRSPPPSCSAAIPSEVEIPEVRLDEAQSGWLAASENEPNTALNFPRAGSESFEKFAYDKYIVKSNIFEPTVTAKGPDPSLRCGPNKVNLSNHCKLAYGKDRNLAKGPSKTNCKGPDVTLLKYAAFKKCQAA